MNIPYNDTKDRKGASMSYATLKDLVDDQAREREKEAFILSPVTKECLTFGELKEKTGQLAEVLKTQGLVKGEKVSLMLKNGISAAISFYGVTCAGGVVIPINFNLKENDLTYLLEDSDSRYLITSKDIMENLPEPIKRLETVILEQDLYLLKLRERDQSQSYIEDDNIREEDMALILYTSGTTGKPKGVILTHKNLIAEAFHIYEAHKLTSEDRVLCLLPLYHINGLVVTLITPLLAGLSIVMPEKFSASRFFHWIFEYQVAWFSAVPTILSIILGKEVDKNLDLSSLKFARSASAALPVAVLEEFEHRFHIPVIESYGISEGGSQITTNPMPPEKRKAGSVGLPYGNELLVVDEQNQICKPHQEGEVIVKGDNISAGYYKKEEETQKSFREGWFYTGDLGYKDEDGYLFLKGRKKELINRAGEKFSPREIDEVLYLIPEVELAAAVGVPDPLYNEEVVAYIKLREGTQLDAEVILNFCRERLVEFKTPKEILFTEDFPKGPSGKIQRLKLAQQYVKEK